MWAAWTTQAGLESFFGPKARIALRPLGPFEIFFFPDAPKGQRGAENLRLLSLMPREMISFEWNAPLEYPNVRKQRTWVVVQLREAGPDGTVVTLTHLGWKTGAEWQQAYDYFTSAWDVVLGRLARRFDQRAPIDWGKEGGPAKK